MSGDDRRMAGFGTALLWAVLSLGCRGSEPRLVVFQGATMGTTYTVKVVAVPFPAAREEKTRRLIDKELEDVNAKMSHYLEDSELSRFNRFRETTPFVLTEETFRVFLLARELSELTKGAFDITVAPLVNAWGFGPPGRPEHIPSDAEIQRLLETVGYEKLELDEKNHTVRKAVSRLICDLSAIAKGYGVDRVAGALEGEQISNYMVEVGGEVRTQGVNDQGQPWRIGIERPWPEGRAIQRVVALSGWAMASSGDYRNYYEVDGHRYTHMIDPRKGRPITHRLASVSVVDKRCARADGLATALLVLGPEEGYRLAVDADIAAFFLLHGEDGGFEERETPAFTRLLEQ